MVPGGPALAASAIPESGGTLSISTQDHAATAAAAAKSLQLCLTVRPHRRQPARLRCPWDSPGKNTGVGCDFLLQCTNLRVFKFEEKGESGEDGDPGPDPFPGV